MGERSGAPRASALHQSSFRNLRLRFNYRSQMSQLTVTHPTIGIEQQGRHHARIEWRLTKPAFVACDDPRQIQVLARQSDDELRQMVRRHIIDARRRQELRLINCPSSKMSTHVAKGIRACPHLSHARAQTKCRPARKLRAVFS